MRRAGPGVDPGGRRGHPERADLDLLVGLT
jgi:hypothetical protein